MFDANHVPEFLFEASPPDGKIILDRDGIHFVNGSLLSRDKKNEPDMDADFKNLVESVLN